MYPFSTPDGELILREIFIEFTLKVIESGLDVGWEELSYVGIKFKFRKSFGEQDFTVLGFAYFEVCWWILAIGIVLSLLAFLAEFISKTYKGRSLT